MSTGRTLLLAVDGLDTESLLGLRDGEACPHPLLTATSLARANPLTVHPGGPSEPPPALASLITGASVARTGIATAEPLPADRPESRSTWYARSMTAPTLFDQLRRQGRVTAALQWPATAGAAIDLCLPLVEDLRHYRNRWDMALSTSSARMVREHLEPRREAGVQLSQVPPDDLVAEIAAEALGRDRIDLLAARLSGLGAAHRAAGRDTAAVQRAMLDTADALEQIVTAFSPADEDRVLLVPGRPLVPTALLVHPNAALAAHGLLRTDGPRLDSFQALVWPDGPRGVVHVHRHEGPATREAALAALRDLSAHVRLSLRLVDDGVGATEQTDVIAVLEGGPGTVFGLSATHRPLVEGDDPYYAGPLMVSDPSAAAVALARGPGLPTTPAAGSWADLGVTLARALGIELPGATAHGMRAEAAAGTL